MATAHSVHLTPSSDSCQYSADAKERAKDIKKLHEQVGDLVWIHFRKERFPNQPNAKSSPIDDGPFKAMQKINDNSYIVGLPGS
ncbi:hypothetical protein SESBI_06383 [Sesbania bispinosa]|nr:hypothetical protein SESBI_06383 [Sesbania bispinosa]